MSTPTYPPPRSRQDSPSVAADVVAFVVEARAAEVAGAASDAVVEVDAAAFVVAVEVTVDGRTIVVAEFGAVGGAAAEPPPTSPPSPPPPSTLHLGPAPLPTPPPPYHL